ncbi:MAG: C39 family peptidase [Chloroflexota bacterium]
MTALLPPGLGVSTVAAQSVDATPTIEPTTAWAKTARDTSIWSGWDDRAAEFAKIGPNIMVQLIELRGTRAYVYFPGDAKGHKPGEVWVDRADLTDVPWPRWARARRATVLRSAPNLGAEEIIPLARGNYIETTGDTSGRWAKAFYLIDRGPGEWVMGWVDGLDLMLPRGDQAEISTYMLTRNSLLTSTPEVWLRVPYRSQIDGSAYADANCGPTSVAMALESVGKSESLGSVRELALDLQKNPRCDDCGTYIQHLAAVAEMRGAKTYGLREKDDPEAFHRWSLDDVRQQLRQERVVIPQVKYRALPGRSRIPYGGDHYVVVVGIVGNDFIYNDPVDSDGRGYGRLITAEQLETAMSSANGEFARAAFAVGR